MLGFLAQTSPDSWQEALEKVWHFFVVGGWYMLPIALCSMVGVTLVIFKFLDLRSTVVAPARLCATLSQVDELVAAGKLAELKGAIRAHESVLSRICQHALLSTHSSKESAERSTEGMAREEVSRLERGIPGLEVIFTIAPMVGLIGTVGGLVSIFGTFGARAAGPDQAAIISKGISEALNTTIAGLAVAVPCYIFQSYFSRRLETLALRMANLVNGLISAAYRAEPEPVPAPEPMPVSMKKLKEKKVVEPESPESELEADPA